MTPEWAYGITTIKPDVIRKTAREMCNAAPAVIIHPGRHVTWYGDDTQRANVLLRIRPKSIQKDKFGDRMLHSNVLSRMRQGLHSKGKIVMECCIKMIWLAFS